MRVTMKRDPDLIGRPAGPGAVVSDAELMRDALLGAGTSVWEWQVGSDLLSSVDTSAALLGYGRGELASNQAAWNELIHPDDRDANHAAYLRHADGREPIYEHEYRARARDGAWRWIAERGRVVERAPDGTPLRMVGTLSDVTERRRAQVEVLAMAGRLREITRHAPGVVYQYRALPDGSGSFPFVSDSCIDVFGFPSSVLMQDAVRALRMIERDDRERVFASIDRARRAMQHWRCEFRLHAEGGAQRWVRASATPRREDDGALLWHGYLEDVTDLRALNQAREEVAAAQAANLAKTEFLSRMSHELRTPLNAVLGFAQLLELDPNEPLSVMQRKRVGLIREAGDHLRHMIGELLDLTRIESGRLAVEIAALAVAPLLDECAEMVRPQADAAGVSLQVEAAADLPPVRADPTRLRQVLLNLLTNAVKYNRRGGAVRVRVERGPGELSLRVNDTGVGIAEAELADLFEPFNRGAHRRSAIEGTGIGLAVTKGLVQLMHGRLDVQSTPGVGSTFSVTLPSA